MTKYLAQIDDAGNVAQVIVCESIEWAQSRLGGTWIETAIDGATRARYAGIGYVYKPDLDAFLPPQPAWNWAVDGETKNWVFPDDNHLYIPADPRLIEQLSRGLYALIDPTRDGLYAGIIHHPLAEQDARLWPLLQLRSEDVVPISLAANSEPLTQVLQAFVDGNGLTLAEMQGLVGAVAAMAGQTVRIADMIPASWQPYILTREAAAALGYFGGEPNEDLLRQFTTGVQSMAERGGI